MTTSIKKEIITQFEGSTFASHEDVVKWLSQALTRIEEAERERITRMRDEHILKYGYAHVGIPMSRKMHKQYHELMCGECQAYRKILSPSEEKEFVSDTNVTSKETGEKKCCHLFRTTDEILFPTCDYCNKKCPKSYSKPTDCYICGYRHSSPKKEDK